MRAALPILCLGLAATAAAAAPGLQDENFLTPLPHGFKIGSDVNFGKLTTQEMVPVDETVQHWTRMITVQIFHGLRNRPGTRFLQNMGAIWQHVCPQSTHGPIVNDVSNGYPVSQVLLTCSRDPLTGKAETTMFRTVSGADSFYVAQYAFGYAAGARDISLAVDYLKTVNACDTRDPTHSCLAVFPGASTRL